MTSLLRFTLLLFILCLKAQAGDLSALSSAAGGHSDGGQDAIPAAVSSIPARIEYLKLGYKVDYADVMVCIEGNSRLRGAKLLLDVKLAYAAWMNAAGLGDAESWGRLKFALQAHCGMQTHEYASVIVVGEDGTRSAATDEKSFHPASVHCAREGEAARCVGTKMTLGLGGPGGVGFMYVTPGKWEKVQSLTPASLLLNPHVKWSGLGEDLRVAAPALNAEYAALVGRAESAGFKDLAAFNDKLQAQRVILKRRDPGLAKITDKFLDSKQSQMQSLYVPEHGAFHVLLHEVGHQFGMSHAENAGVMANTDEYAYLSGDDTRKAQALARSAHGVAESHRSL